MNLHQRMSQDKQMILNPDRWPQWPCLPLKRYGKDRDVEIGVLTHDDDYVRGVYVVSMTNLFSNTPPAEFKTYNNVDELLVDGWEVD